MHRGLVLNERGTKIMSAKRMPNLKEDQLLRAVKHLNKKKRGDVCTGDVAEYLGYHASGILLQLSKLGSKGAE